MNQKTCLLVLGMHRSGTSTLAGVLNILGIELGSSLLPPTTENTKGYFENQYIMSLNETLFSGLFSKILNILRIISLS